MFPTLLNTPSTWYSLSVTSCCKCSTREKLNLCLLRFVTTTHLQTISQHVTSVISAVFIMPLRYMLDDTFLEGLRHVFLY